MGGTIARKPSVIISHPATHPPTCRPATHPPTCRPTHPRLPLATPIPPPLTACLPLPPTHPGLERPLRPALAVVAGAVALPVLKRLLKVAQQQHTPTLELLLGILNLGLGLG